MGQTKNAFEQLRQTNTEPNFSFNIEYFEQQSLQGDHKPWGREIGVFYNVGQFLGNIFC